MEHCPHCSYNFDDGDIYEVLRNNEYYQNMTDEQVKDAARCYGWSEENRKRFTKKILYQPVRGKQFYKCPECDNKL